MVTQLESVNNTSIQEDPRPLCQSKGSFQDLPQLNWKGRDKNTNCGGSHQQECSIMIKFKRTIPNETRMINLEQSQTANSHLEGAVLAQW